MQLHIQILHIYHELKNEASGGNFVAISLCSKGIEKTGV
jgi:hypothetical protein